MSRELILFHIDKIVDYFFGYWPNLLKVGKTPSTGRAFVEDI
jgi:hypothetical protein